MIYFTSDLHFNHDKEFIYKARGFSSVEEMNKALVDNFNSIVTPEDDVYILGDLMLGDYEKGLELIKQLNGKIRIILGNHDTDNRVELYLTLPNVVYTSYADVIKYNKQSFYLSHYPTHTGNKEKHLSTQVINLYGHTHQKDLFYNDDHLMYNVGVDSHNNRPVSIDDILKDIRSKKDVY